jgi:peptide/nickel transport system substrate-binding protein
MKKILILLIVLAVAAAAFAGGKDEAPAMEEAPKKVVEEKVIKNPDTFINAGYGSVDTIDPAKGYDDASDAIIQNIYETLVDFKGGSTSDFIPLLATEVPTVANGGITNGGKTYRFKIRKGVKFHSGNELTPEGVAYSFRRHLVSDPDGGPQWMFFEAYWGTYSSRDGDGNVVLTMDQLEDTIQVDGDYVVFNLKVAYAPFISILCGTWGAVVDKDFVIANGGWDGTAGDITRVNGPEEGQEILYDITSGTGPYKLARWEKGVEVVLERNEAYWGSKPAMKKAIYRVVEEWSTRKLMLIQGDADFVIVDPMYFAEMDKEPGLQIFGELKSLGNRGINYNMKITSTDNPAIFSGKLDGQGIPPDFFSDPDVRWGFTYAYDQETYIRDIIAYSGVPSPTPIPAGLPYFNTKLKNIPFDLKKSEEHFKKAWGGQVWEKGFKLDMLFNSGNEVRESTLKMMAENIMSLNPKFELNVRGIEWATYVDMTSNRTMPLYFIGWGADFPDPHNFFQPYMHSSGYFGGRCGYNNPEVDALIEEGAVSTDLARREEIYLRLQDIWLEDNIGIMMHQPIRRWYFKDWVQGYFFHPMENRFKYKMFEKSY